MKKEKRKKKVMLRACAVHIIPSFIRYYRNFEFRGSIMKWWVVMVVALSGGRGDWYFGMEEGGRVVLVVEKERKGQVGREGGWVK